MSNEADILSSLDRIESLVDGFLELGKSEDAEIFYHGTLEEHLPSILAHGLNPNQKMLWVSNRRNSAANWARHRSLYWVGREMHHKPSAVLRFKTPIATQEDPNLPETPESSITYHRIPPEDIEIAVGNPFEESVTWRPLHEHLKMVKSEDLTKMAMADKPMFGDKAYSRSWTISNEPATRENVSKKIVGFDYTHLLPQDLRDSGYSLHVHQVFKDGASNSLFGYIKHPTSTKPNGSVGGYLLEDKAPHADSHVVDFDPQHRGKGLGTRLASHALLAAQVHGYKHAGIKFIRSYEGHTEAAKRVHDVLTDKEDYEIYKRPKLLPSEEVKQKPGPWSSGKYYLGPRENPDVPFAKSEELAKTESLAKMAIADIKPSDTGDYSHLVPEHLRNDYSIHLTEDEDADYDKALVAKIRYKGEHAGTIVGNISGNSITTHQYIKPIHHNKKLGNAGMEAVLAHAFHKFGVTEVAEHDHTVAASRVHASLSRKHGMGYNPTPLDDDTMYHEGYVIKSENGKMPSGSDSIVLDIDKAPQQHLEPSFYRITPDVQRAYQMMGRGASVANGQYVSDPSPSVGGGVSLAFDNDKDLHDYVENIYEPHLVKNVLPSLAANKAVLLAPVPIHSLKHGNHSPFLTINHLHGVSVSQDRRGRVPFYFTMAKLASEIGHVHPLLPPAISEYHEAPHQHHIIKMVDGNGRAVSARTAGSTHVLSYVTMKPEHVEPFLKMLHETAPSEDMPVRSILGLPELPNKFSVGDIPKILSHTKKSERRMLDNLDKVESLVDTLIGRR